MEGSPIVRLYRLVYDKAREPVVVLAADGRLLFANHAARERSRRFVDAVLSHLERASACVVRGAMLCKGRVWSEIEIDHARLALDSRRHGDQLVVHVRERPDGSYPAASDPPGHGWL